MRSYPTDYAPRVEDGSAGGRARQRAIWKLRRDPVGELAELRRTQGGIACFKLGRQRVFYLSDAEILEEIFVDASREVEKWGRAERWWFRRPPTYVEGRLLSTHDRRAHATLRRGLQPAFRSQRAEQDVGTMEQLVRDALTAAGVGPLDLYRLFETVNVSAAITSLTDVRPSAEEERDLVQALHDLDSPATHRFSSPSYRLLDSLRRRSPHSGYGRLAELLGGLLTRGRGRRDDSLPALYQRLGLTRDEGTELLLGSLVSGYSVSAAALLILALHCAEPELGRRVRDELDSVAGERLLQPDDLSRLPLCHNLILETLRFAGGWQVSRLCQRPFTARDVRFQPGDWLLAAPFWLHRDHRYYASPERFWPERWSDPDAPPRPRLAYMPFGVGARKCIGSEVIVTLLVAYLGALRRFDVRPDRRPEQVFWHANRRGEFSLATPVTAVVEPFVGATRAEPSVGVRAVGPRRP